MCALLLLAGLIACGDGKTEPLDPPDDMMNTDPLCAETEGDLDHQIWRFEGGGITVWMTRQNVGPGGGRTAIYEPQRFTLEREGRSECITDLALMKYTWTHHNWEDEMEATADGLRWRIWTFEAGQFWKLEAKDSSGAIAVEPIDLTVVSSPYSGRSG